MRPFRFFFGITLAVLIFFTLAKFLVVAGIIAAVMSVIFFLFKSAIRFFRGMDWEGDWRQNRRRYHPYYLAQSDESHWSFPNRSWGQPKAEEVIRTIKIQ